MASASALRSVPFMGVIHVVAEAVKLGFQQGDPDWCNLGQGQPDVGPLPGAPPRIDRFDATPLDHAYGPVEGTLELRTAVANHMNRLYRAGKSSLYGPENVAIASGGRATLSRVVAALDRVRLGYQVPDYTAYQDLLEYHSTRVTAVPIFAEEGAGFRLGPAELDAAIESEALDAFLVSNPCNPTGQVVAGDELAAWVETARSRGTTLVLDEFYSHFVFDGARPAPEGVSAARYVDDVNVDPVLLIDGLTKCFRYPGWRVGWVVGPKSMIGEITRAASAIDGGPNTWVQRAACRVLEPEAADQELEAMRRAFAPKRFDMRTRLEALGLRCVAPAPSTFYVWASLADLPAPFDDAESFFRLALAEKVMTVPGRFFDVDPHGQRGENERWRTWMRFSFGPSAANVDLGLSRLEGLLTTARTTAAR